MVGARALAHAGLAYEIALSCMYSPETKNQLGDAERASERALELDPDSAEAHCAMGTVLLAGGRLEEAERVTRRALAIEEKAHGPDHEMVGGVLRSLAEISGRLPQV